MILSGVTENTLIWNPQSKACTCKKMNMNFKPPNLILPLSSEGPFLSKSFTTLINTSYSMKNDGETTESNRDSGILSNPLSFLHSGFYGWSTAELLNRGVVGNYWSLRSANLNFSCNLGFVNNGLSTRVNSNRGDSFAVHYELHFSFLELLKDFLKVFRRGH